MCDLHFFFASETLAQTLAPKYAIQFENSHNKRERYGKQIKEYLSICGKDQSVRKDWCFVSKRGDFEFPSI